MGRDMFGNLFVERRRSENMDIYQTPDGKWAASFLGEIKDGFNTREEALEWTLAEVERSLGKIWEFLGLLARELSYCQGRT